MVFCLYIIVYNFVFLWCMSISMFSSYFYFSALCWFVYCLFSIAIKKERTWTWVREEEGRVWEQLRKGNLDQNTLYWKTFSIKNKTCLKDEKSKNHVMSMVKSSKMTLFFSNRKANFPCRLFEHLFHGLPLNAKPIWFWNSTSWIPQWLPVLPHIIIYTSWHLAIISERNSQRADFALRRQWKNLEGFVCTHHTHMLRWECAHVCVEVKFNYLPWLLSWWFPH